VTDSKSRNEGDTVWIYEEGDVLKIFDTEDEAHTWFKDNDPEGVAFKHTVGPLQPAGTADQHGLRVAREADAIEE
jgi:hypothetical protein